MTHFTRLLCTTALGTLLLPQIVAADVTPEDVWKNQQDYFATFGGTFTNTVSRTGDTLTVRDIKLAYQLPLGAGSILISLPNFSMVDNADGSVAITYPSPTLTYSVAVEITGKGSVSGTLDLTTRAYQTTATGVPDDVTYTWSIDRIDMQSRDIEIHQTNPAKNVPKDLQLTATGTLLDLSGVTRITVAEHVTTESNLHLGEQDVSFVITGEGVEVTSTYGAESDDFTTQTTLPRDGFDVMNLAAALRDGLTFQTTRRTSGYHTSQITKLAGKVTDQQSSGSQEQTSIINLDQSGLHVKGDFTDAYLKMPVSNEIPIPLEIQVAKGRAGITLPLLAASETQDLAFDFVLEGLTMADNIWALFDPEQTLPRDPMDITLDMSAKVLTKLDWLDFLTVKAKLEAGTEHPIELHAATLNSLLVQAVGARLTGSGAATFDNTDLKTFDGFPAPTGVIDLALKGGNGLLDRLVAMGLLSDQDAMGARMATAAFSQPDPSAGEDALKSRLEITSEGHILANGQRLK